MAFAQYIKDSFIMLHKKPIRPACTLSLMLGVTLVFLGRDLLIHEFVSEIFKEGHSVEAISVAILIAAAAFCIGHRGLTATEWHIPVILILMALRELDVDKSFTSEGVLQLRLYTGSSPLWEKVVGLAVAALILVCIWRLVRLTLPRCWRGLQQGVGSAWLATGATVLIMAAKSMDGIDRKLAPLGITFEPAVGIKAGRLEEMLEIAAYIMLAQAVVYGARPRTLAGQRPQNAIDLRTDVSRK